MDGSYDVVVHKSLSLADVLRLWVGVAFVGTDATLVSRSRDFIIAKRK